MNPTLAQMNPTQQSPKPRRLSRRALLRASIVGVGSLGTAALYANQIERFWTEFNEVTLKLPRLPRVFDGFRIAHLSDLHVGEHVSNAFIERTVARVNALRPDIAVVSGDVINHGAEWIEPAARMLSKLRMPTYVSFGNHDYLPDTGWPRGADVLSVPLAAALRGIGLTVLRNAAVPIVRGGERLWIAGLEDFYTQRFDPVATFAAIPAGEAVVCLSHNPDSAEDLKPFVPDVILAGHTHGGQIRLPFVGPILLPITHREWYTGVSEIGPMKLLVSRGVGHLLPIRIFCRPEVPMVTLRCSIV